MKAWQLVGVGLLCGLLAAGVIVLVSQPPRGHPVTLPEAPDVAGIRVDVSGAVANPGVYTLPPGSRVEDAVAAAGGVLADGLAEALNMAAPLSDGSKVLVPLKGAAVPLVVDDGSSITESQITFPININTANQDALMALPGIGETKAQAIIDYRTQHGPFTAPEDLMKVSGIGPATYDKLKDLITIY